MSGLFGRKGQSTAVERYTGIQVSTSLIGGVIPLVYGRQRLPFNLLWYGNFTSTGQSSPGKGGGDSGNSSFNYATAFLAGLCIGPINGVGQVWHDKALETLTSENLALSLGGSGPAIWSFLTSNFPAQAIPYDHIAYVASSAYNLGNSAAMPNLTFETDALLGFNIGAGMVDADPAHLIPDYLTDAVHGAGFQGTIATLTGLTNSYQAYCMSLGMQVSPCEITQRTATSFLTDMLQITNSDAVLSVGTLKIIPYADVFVSGTTPDGSSWSYAPSLTPIYSFGDADYRPDPGDDPVVMLRTGMRKTFNNVNVEYLDRSNAYNSAIANANDKPDIAKTGLRTMNTVTLHQICNGTLARVVAQLILNASLYERNRYQLNVRPDYSLLEPMDIVALTESKLGMVNQVVRILEVDDSEEDVIGLTVQEIPGTVRNTPAYNWSGAAGYAANYAASPGSVDAPVIFQMPAVPASLTQGITLGIAVCGSSGNAFWNGCNAFISVDGTTYDYVGTVTAPAAYGTLTASLASVADPDTTSTLAISLVNSNLQLGTSVTHAEADANQTLILVGSGATAEIMSYGAATLTSAGHYNLTYLRRGLYGSKVQAHLSGVPFARLNGNIFQIALDPGMGGQTVNFKFCSFNTWGQATQDISTVTAYPYTAPAGPVGGAVTLQPRGSCAFDGENVAKAANAATAWDSDCISTQPYSSCSISGQFGTGVLAIGLVSSIASIAVPATIDFAIFANGSPIVEVGESGTIKYVGGAPVPGDLYLISYDGFTVRYFVNGALVWMTAAPGLSLYPMVAENTPGAVLSNVRTVANTASTPAPFIARGNCQVSDNNIIKQGGATVWDSDCYSIVGYPVCHMAFKANQTTAHLMMALNHDPSTDSNFTSLDYALYCLPGGVLEIEESGTVVLGGMAYDTTSLLAITYDGSTITYSKDGVAIRTVTVSGLTLFMDSSFFTPGGGVNSVRFGPTTNLAVSDTAQIGVNAASTMNSAAVSSSISVVAGLAGVLVNTDIISFTLTTTGQPVAIDAACTAFTGGASGVSCSIVNLSVYRDGTQVAGMIWDPTNGGLTNIGGSSIAFAIPVTLTVTDAPAAGSHTYTLHGQIQRASGAGTMTIACTENFIKVREIKR